MLFILLYFCLAIAIVSVMALAVVGLIKTYQGMSILYTDFEGR